MPRRDGTGPFGKRPIIGRGDGYCAVSDRPGIVSSRWGLGRGRRFHNRGRGIGQGAPSVFPRGVFRGMRCFRWFGNRSSISDPGLDKQALRLRAEELRTELDIVEKRLDEAGGRI
mgnify:CR=1 FL=1